MKQEDLARLSFLQGMTPTQLSNKELDGELCRLEADYRNETALVHEAFVAAVLAEKEVKEALNYDYDYAMLEVEKGMLNTPTDLTLRSCAGLLLRIQGWKDYISKFLGETSKHYSSLDSACERVIANWRGKTLARSEWQAKAEALSSATNLIKLRDRAKMSRGFCYLVHESLVGQWQTISRVSTIITEAATLGDIDVPNIDLLFAKEN